MATEWKAIHDHVIIAGPRHGSAQPPTERDMNQTIDVRWFSYNLLLIPSRSAPLTRRRLDSSKSLSCASWTGTCSRAGCLGQQDRHTAGIATLRIAIRMRMRRHLARSGTQRRIVDAKTRRNRGALVLGVSPPPGLVCAEESKRARRRSDSLVHSTTRPPAAMQACATGAQLGKRRSRIEAGKGQYESNRQDEGQITGVTHGGTKPNPGRNRQSGVAKVDLE